MPGRRRRAQDSPGADLGGRYRRDTRDRREASDTRLAYRPLRRAGSNDIDGPSMLPQGHQWDTDAVSGRASASIRADPGDPGGLGVAGGASVAGRAGVAGEHTRRQAAEDGQQAGGRAPGSGLAPPGSDRIARKRATRPAWIALPRTGPANRRDATSLPARLNWAPRTRASGRLNVLTAGLNDDAPGAAGARRSHCTPGGW